jgi:TUG ubiquitin-like protein
MNVMPLRVMVEDVWDEVFLELPAEVPVAEVKRQALERTKVPRDPSEFVLKFRGAELVDESIPIADAGLVPNAALMLLSRRRRPVR